jgi:hypothetical protein
MLRRKCLLTHIIERKIEGGIEVTVRQERRRKQLLDDLKKRRGYWKWKEDALYCTGWSRGYGPIVTLTMELIN